MNKKMVILLISCFLLTGCSSKYTVDFGKSGVLESLSLISTRSDEIDLSNQEYNNLLNEYSSSKLPARYPEFEDLFVYDNSSVYSISRNSTNNNLSASYKFEDIDDYFFSTILYYNADETQYKVTNGVLYVYVAKLSSLFDKYKFLDEMTVVVKTDYQMYEANCDYYSKEGYVWNITKANLANKTIGFTINTNKLATDLGDVSVQGNLTTTQKTDDTTTTTSSIVSEVVTDEAGNVIITTSSDKTTSVTEKKSNIAQEQEMGKNTKKNVVYTFLLIVSVAIIVIGGCIVAIKIMNANK